jgi:hypothetical protein
MRAMPAALRQSGKKASVGENKFEMENIIHNSSQVSWINYTMGY